MSYSREFLIKQFKKGVKDYLPIASAAEAMINYKLSQLDEDDWARIEEFFNSFKFPLHVYRGLNVKSEKDVDFKNPGNNWTVDTALFHAPLSAFRNSNYILEGYIDEDQIDWPETVQNFMYYSVNAARNQRYPENEVTLKKRQVPHDLTGAMKESLTEDVDVPDKPSAQDKFRYYWELESRAIKQPQDLLRKFKNKFPNQYDIWGETFEWMLEHNEDSFVEPENYALYLEYDLDTNWGYIAIVEFKGRYQESLNEVYPQKNETKSDFINRFMRVTAKEYPDVKQRYAVANSYWDNRDRKRLNEEIDDKAVALIFGSLDYSELRGKVIFTQKEDVVDVDVNLVNLPQSQFLGFHIHSGSECTGNEKDPFKNAKTHFNPSRKSHPEHAGDLPALYSSNGQIHTTFETDKFTIADIIGKTIIIHSDRDDFTSQPAGDAGDKIACGVIKKYTLEEAYLDAEEKFWDYRTKEVEPGQYIDTTRNEIRWVDDMLEDPAYYEKKGYTARIVEMSPEEYFEQCAELFGNSIEAQKRQIAADTGVLDDLTQVIKKYHKRFPIPFINIKDRTQEGRHRMYVLGELFGWDKKVPVLIIQDVNNVRVTGKEIK